MTTSAQIAGALAVVAAVLVVAVLPIEPRTRALLAALVLTVGGGTMAFLRSRHR